MSRVLRGRSARRVLFGDSQPKRAHTIPQSQALGVPSDGAPADRNGPIQVACVSCCILPGGEHGHDVGDWFEAQRQLRGELQPKKAGSQSKLGRSGAITSPSARVHGVGEARRTRPVRHNRNNLPLASDKSDPVCWDTPGALLSEAWRGARVSASERKPATRGPGSPEPLGYVVLLADPTQDNFGPAAQHALNLIALDVQCRRRLKPIVIPQPDGVSRDGACDWPVIGSSP